MNNGNIEIRRYKEGKKMEILKEINNNDMKYEDGN